MPTWNSSRARAAARSSTPAVRAAWAATRPRWWTPPELRVRGVDRLRLIDASVMPAMVSANTNAAAILIGEKGADLVRGRQRLDAA